MSITKQIENQIENDPIFAELYEQHESAKFHRFIQKTTSLQEAIANFNKETNMNKPGKTAYNKLHTT